MGNIQLSSDYIDPSIKYLGWKNILKSNPSVEYIGILVEKKGFSLIADNKKFTPLHKALILKCDAPIIKKIIQYSDLNFRNQDGDTPLNIAIYEKSDPEIIKLLIEGSDVNIANNEGSTPLHVAIAVNDLEAVKLLCCKANPHLTDVEGKSCVWSMAAKGLDFSQLTGPVVLSEYDQEFHRRYLLANIWSLEFKTTMQGKTFELCSSGRGYFGTRLVQHFLEKYSEYLEAGSSTALPFFKQVLGLITNNLETSKENPGTLLEKFNRNEYLSFSAGFSEHSFKVLMMGDYYFVCNRGFGKEASSITAYKIDRKSHRVQEKDFLTIQNYQFLSQEEANTFFYEELPAKLGCKDEDILSKFFNKKFKQQVGQKAPNCWWTNSKLEIIPLLAMCLLQHVNPAVFSDAEILKNTLRVIFRDVYENYKGFSEFVRIYVLNQDLFPKFYASIGEDHELIYQIVKKMFEKEKKHILKRKAAFLNKNLNSRSPSPVQAFSNPYNPMLNRAVQLKILAYFMDVTKNAIDSYGLMFKLGGKWNLLGK